MPPSIDVKDDKEDTEDGENVLSQKIGIIYPPNEVRNIVDKTASFVARNGPEFESRIRQNELGNPKFNFLNPGDPYHGYYQHKVKEFQEGKGQEPTSALSGPPGTQQTQKPTVGLKHQELLKQTQILDDKPFELKEPPSEYEFLAEPPSISAQDLDVVKLTAQFVARNGRSFLTDLMSREQRNYQFDFLRPQHSLFQYFTKLLEHYSKILIPPKGIVDKLNEECSNIQVVLDDVKYRAEWEKHEEDQKRKEEQIIEKERVAYAQIDWHDFVVVETVDYQIGEIGNFPPPTTPDEVGARVLKQQRREDKKKETGNEDEYEEEDENGMEMGSDDEMIDRTGRESSDEASADEEVNAEEEAAKRKSKEGKDNTQVEDMEEESSEESDNEPDTRIVVNAINSNMGKTTNAFVPPLPPLPPAPDKVIVKKGYDPKLAARAAKTAASDEMISPLTGTKIPASKVQEHMRIGLLDPRWVEQRDKHIKDKMNQESVYAPGAAIEASLKQLAERRTDIFGIGDEETAIGKKIGEEDVRKDDKITWDGHTSSVEAATRAARANITIEDQIHQIHKVKGLIPDEEKEKIGPKPVHGEHNSPLLPTPLMSISSKPMTFSNSAAPPPLPKQPPLPPPMNKPPAPPVSRPPLPPAPPTMVLPPRPPAPPVVLIPGGPVPPMQSRILLPPQPVPPYPLMQTPGPPVPPQFMTGTQNMAPSLGQPVTNSMKHGHSASEKSDEEPVLKKMRTEETLEPEDVFLAKNKSPVQFKIVAPSLPDKSEWNLTGQTMEFNLPLTDSVSVIKAMIHESTNMPPGKQKLQWDGLFLKDSNSLAYYNINPSTILHLQLKERGGRKKAAQIFAGELRAKN